MAGINVNHLTSMLAKLQPDSALQKYALDNKNDPYIVSLAASESNRRKELRSAAQAAQGMQQQPKVVDAAIAQMAPQPMPEDVGIGQLRAPNMQFGAEGGIMGYDEGYDEGGMTYGQDPVMMMANGGHVPRYQGNPRDGSLVRMPYGQPTANMTGEIPGFVAGTPIFQTQPSVDPEEPFFRRLLRERQEAVETQRVQEARVRALKGQPLSAEDQARIRKADTTVATNAAAAQDMAQFDAASNLYMTERAAKQAAAKPVPAVDNKVANKKPSAAPPPAATLPPAAVPEQSVTDRYAAMQKAMGLNDTSKVDAERQAVYDAMRTQDKNALEEFEKDVAARGKYGEAKEARLAKREDELGKRKDENTGLALLEAGLAIMSTPGKLAEAVGKGAQVGLKTYGAGLEKLRAAQEKMDDARDQIEEFRRNEANMTAKERRQFKSQINRTETEIEKMGVDAAEKMYGYKREDAKSVFVADTQTRLTGMEIGSREKIAANQERSANARSAAQIAATLNTPDRLVFNQLLKDSGNDAVKAAESLQKLKTEKFNVYDAYSKYLQAFAGKDTLKGPDDFEVFAKRFIPTVTPSENTTIRKQPGG